MAPSLYIDVEGLDVDVPSSDDEYSDSGSESQFESNDSECTGTSASSERMSTSSTSSVRTMSSMSSEMSLSPTPATTTQERVFFDETKMYNQLQDRIALSMMAVCGLDPEEPPPLAALFHITAGRRTVSHQVARLLRTTESMIHSALCCIKLSFDADSKIVPTPDGTRKTAARVTKVAVSILERLTDADREEEKLVREENDFCVTYMLDVLAQKHYMPFIGTMTL
jgi:hypothetical protein